MIPTGFDDDGRPVPTADFDYDAIDGAEPEDTDTHLLRQETIIRLLQMLSTGGNAKQVGQRVLLLAYLFKVSDCKNQRELAKQLKVTPGRVSQGLNVLRAELARI